MSMRPLCAASVGLGRRSGFPWRPTRVGIVAPPPTEDGRGHKSLQLLLSPPSAAAAASLPSGPCPCKPSLSTSATLAVEPPPTVVFEADRAKREPENGLALSITGGKTENCHGAGRRKEREALCSG